MPHIIGFDYLNHHGKLATRHVEVSRLQFEFRPGFGYQPGWFLNGTCLDKKATRSFALDRIILPEGLGQSQLTLTFLKF